MKPRKSSAVFCVRKKRARLCELFRRLIDAKHFFVAVGDRIVF